jgi:NAD(P) transhydrogenase subunit alpha
MPSLSSRLYGNAIAAMLQEMGSAEDFSVDIENEIIRGALVTHEHDITWPPPKPEEPTTSTDYAKDFGKRPDSESVDVEHTPIIPPAAKRGIMTVMGALAGLALILAIGLWAPADFTTHFTVFVLACFVGWQVVWAVTPALHTPLMSVTNAISGIIVVGGLLGVASTELNLAAMLGGVAILVASINIAGGFLVTHRMLQMFRKEDK